MLLIIVLAAAVSFGTMFAFSNLKKKVEELTDLYDFLNEETTGLNSWSNEMDEKYEKIQNKIEERDQMPDFYKLRERL